MSTIFPSPAGGRCPEGADEGALDLAALAEKQDQKPLTPTLSQGEREQKPNPLPMGEGKNDDDLPPCIGERMADIAYDHFRSTQED